MLRHEFRMLPEPVAGSFDLNDDGMVKQPVEQRRCDNGISEDVAPFCKAACRFAFNRETRHSNHLNEIPLHFI